MIEIPQDEVLEIKRVMKIASARQLALSSLSNNKNLKSYNTNHDITNTNNTNGPSSNSNGNSNSNCNNCKKLKEEVIECNSTIDSIKRELRECNYNLQLLKDKERYNTNNDTMELLKNKAIIVSLKQSIDNLENDRTNRDKILCNELDNITRQLTRLEKHTLNNHSSSSSSSVTSKVTINLLVNIKNGIDSMKNNYLYSNKLGTIDDNNRHKPITIINNIDSSNSTSSIPDPLDSALLDMCKHLEDENSKLHQTIQSLNEELQLSQRESSISKLIPHYRLAIVRCKSQLAHSKEQLKTEQQCSKLLRIQLEEMYAQFDIKKINKDESLSSSSSSNKDKSNRKKEHYNNNDNKKKIVDDDIDTYNELNNEIIDLDAEINILREQLEQAALSHTQKILTGVIEKSTSIDSSKLV